MIIIILTKKTVKDDQEMGRNFSKYANNREETVKFEILKNKVLFAVSYAIEPGLFQRSER